MFDMQHVKNNQQVKSIILITLAINYESLVNDNKLYGKGYSNNNNNNNNIIIIIINVER